MPKPPQMPAEVPPHWGVYFSVANTDDAVKKVEELSGRVMMVPFEVEPGRMAVVADDQGSTFNVRNRAESRREL
jgi:predicted enzyme related to lactoylglutathione lyase